MNGFGKFQYFRGVYISEGGVLKALWLELVNREHVRGREPNYLHLFAASQVTPEMLNSVVNRGPAGQGFEQRRSRGGWVVQGPRPKRVCMGGWVWQEPYNGAVTYYHVPKDSDTVFTFKQWSQDGASWHWSEETRRCMRPTTLGTSPRWPSGLTFATSLGAVVARTRPASPKPASKPATKTARAKVVPGISLPVARVAGANGKGFFLQQQVQPSSGLLGSSRYKVLLT